MNTLDTRLLLTAHGTIDTLEDLPAFLTNIRRGRPAPQHVLDEVRRRYEHIGGRSPLADLTAAQADALAKRTGIAAAYAMRLWHPYPTEVIDRLALEGVRRIVSVPVAPYSVHVYHAAVEEALARVAPSIELVKVAPWNEAPALLDALAASVRTATAGIPPLARAALVMTAHSLPVRVVRAGDPYATLVEATAHGVAARLGDILPWRLAFQSQGMTDDAWLGPDLPTTFRTLRSEGFTHVLIAPIGFLSDHIEILYDLDHEAIALAASEGLTLSRTEALNTDPGLIEAMAGAVEQALSGR